MTTCSMRILVVRREDIRKQQGELLVDIDGGRQLEATTLNGYPTEDVKWENVKWETNVVPLHRGVIVNAVRHEAERVCICMWRNSMNMYL